ncbi:MAG: T9SS type A sorting domain-containing protein [Melioribacteraceae bacterium]|nr:T9SS type A sorting domain-containing protein [Melioribacteraceae bacterium]
MKKTLTLIFLSIFFVPVLIFGQTVVKVPSDVFGGSGGNLNKAIDQAKAAGKLSTTVFELEPYGYYVLTGTIEVPAGQKLTLTAPPPGKTQQTGLPQILWTAAEGVNRDYMITAFGDLSCTNIWFMFANVLGDQVGTVISLEDNPGRTKKVNFEGCLIEYSSSAQGAGAITVKTTSVDIVIRNTYFRNNIDKHFRYYGRAVSFPYSSTGWHINSIFFENCTFANIGYVYMQEGGEYGDDVRFNHCTFLNVVMFTLQSGWWKTMYVTNSLFVNTFMFGDIPATRGNGDPNGGTIRIDSVKNFGFVPPFTDAERKIYFGYNSYGLEPWLIDWMANCPYSQTKRRNRENDQIPVPMPMLSPGTLRFFDTVDVKTGKKVFPLMNREKLYDGIVPDFKLAPTNRDSLKSFMNRKWNDNTDTDWSWKIKENSMIGKWPPEENLSYTTPTLRTGAMGGFPLGDLYLWWPDEYAKWKAQSAAEYATIENKLNKGLTDVKEISNVIPSEYSLSQNYPNPFNPTTNINYSLPKAGYVSLKVYDMLGQVVATLFEGYQNAGSFKVDFDASKLSSGVYVYKLQADNVNISKKLVLMK